MLILVNLIVGLSSGVTGLLMLLLLMLHTFRTPSKAFALLALADSLGSGLGIWEAEIVSSQSGTNTFPSRWTSSVNVSDLD